MSAYKYVLIKFAFAGGIVNIFLCEGAGGGRAQSLAFQLDDKALVRDTSHELIELVGKLDTGDSRRAEESARQAVERARQAEQRVIRTGDVAREAEERARQAEKNAWSVENATRQPKGCRYYTLLWSVSSQSSTF